MKDTHTPALTKAAGKMGGLILLLGMTGAVLAAPEPAPQVQLAHAYGNLPLRFEANQGQTAPQVRFLAHGPGYSLFLTAKEAVLVLQKPVANTQENSSKAKAKKAKAAVLHMQLLGANPKASITGQAPLPGKVNYLRGNDPKQWHTNVPTYAQVKYDQIYPGIDLIYYGRQHQLEYDFIIEPGADPKAIHLAFRGAKEMHLEEGQLVLTTLAGEVSLHKPILYQEIGGAKQVIRGKYVRQGPHQVGFQVGDYNLAYPLVIDPVLSYSTYLGGERFDSGLAIAVDSRGQAYVTGETRSIHFPTRNALQPTRIWASDVFVAKLNRAGDALMYSTYLGAGGNDQGSAIAVDSRGQAYVTGTTFSSGFPTTHNAFQPTRRGGRDVFVAKLSRAGDSLVYSTYLGGRENDSGSGIAVNPRGQAYVTGTTFSSDFPTTHNALQTIPGGDSDAFVAKLSRAGDSLVYSTYLGGRENDSGSGIAVNPRGQAYVTGPTSSSDFPTTHNAFQPNFIGGPPYYNTDAFIAKLNRAGDSLVYSTFLGGSDFDSGSGIAVNPRSQAYVTGKTLSNDFPTTHNVLQPDRRGGWDVFVTKLNRAGDALVYSTYLGGSGVDKAFGGIAVDPRGQAYVIGRTGSANFPIYNPLQPFLRGGYDAFIAKLNRAGDALVYSTYLGGSDFDQGLAIAVDSCGQAYVTGEALSNDFPTTHNAYQPTSGGYKDVFIAKLSSQGLHSCHNDDDDDD